tara:strand:- start:119789 stop:120541 length:753 start_codon:yes stop_codon:yes gene_type:complete
LRYFIEIAYNGSNYHGWQRQPQSSSVQQMLEKAISTILRAPISITGAGRTDTGVHAKQLFAHVDLDENWDASDCEQFKYKLNRFLPADIAILNILPVKMDAHARFDAVSRSYEYIINVEKNPFTTGQAYYFQHRLDIDAMNEAANFLVGSKDFKCFSKTNTDVNNYICAVTEAYWEQRGSQLIFRVSANRFLRNMVRAIVGTLLEIGKGKQGVAHMQDVLASRDRGVAGTSAPAHGLYLVSVKYPEEIFI